MVAVARRWSTPGTDGLRVLMWKELEGAARGVPRGGRELGGARGVDLSEAAGNASSPTHLLRVESAGRSRDADPFQGRLRPALQRYASARFTFSIASSISAVFL